MKKTYQVFEQTHLRFEEGQPGFKSWFKKRHFKALVDYHDNRGGKKYFSIARSGVQFSQYVGVIQVLDITIEILPKTDRSEEESTWHNVLLEMLRQTRFLKLDYLSEASLRYRKHSILHLYFSQYLAELNVLLKRGLVKQYRLKEGNVVALRGSIQFGRQIAKNLIHKERFYTRHQVYDHEHLIHQVLYQALRVLKRLMGHSSISDEINRVMFGFPEMAEISVTENTFERIKLNRKTEPYRKAIAIAKMILLNYSPDIKGGKNELFALLFDMNKLWEEFVYRQLQKAGADVDFQAWEYFWESRKMKPDLIVRNRDESIVLDTKWKIVNDARPSDEDLRQVFAYNIFWGVKRGYLVYPRTSQSPKTEAGQYDKELKTKLDRMTCQVTYIDVLDEHSQLNMNIGSEILRMIEAKVDGA